MPSVAAVDDRLKEEKFGAGIRGRSPAASPSRQLSSKLMQGPPEIAPLRSQWLCHGFVWQGYGWWLLDRHTISHDDVQRS